MMNRMPRFARVLVRAAIGFTDNSGWVMSSHVAMSMMLALFPFVLFTVTLAAFLSQDIDLDSLIDLVFGSWPDQIAAPITAQVRQVVGNTDSRLLTVGGLLAIYFASNGVEALRKAMIAGYHETDQRSFWVNRLLSLLFIVMGGVAILVAATVGLALPLYARFFAEALPVGNLDWLASDMITTVVPMLMLALAVVACHIWLPGRRHALAQVWPGVVLTLVLWAAAGAGFSYYLTQFASYSATYAGLAGVMAALIFLYLMSAILIFGAEFNAALSEYDAS